MRELIWLKYRFIGDAVMATPLMRTVHATKPEFLRILAAKHLVELFGLEPYIASMDATGKVKGIGPFFRQVRELRQAQYDRVFLVNRSVRSALISRFAGIRQRIGHPTEGRGPLLTHKVPFDWRKYEAECYGDLCRAVGIECDDSRVFLNAEPIPSGAVGIHPGSTSPLKAIRPEHLALLVEEIRKRGHPIVLLGGKDEAPYGEALLNVTGPQGIENLIGACSLSETRNRIAGLRQLFCGDTGLVHIGAGVGTPTVSVFAHTYASKWGHHYEPNQVIDVGNDDIGTLDPQKLIAALR